MLKKIVFCLFCSFSFIHATNISLYNFSGVPIDVRIGEEGKSVFEIHGLAHTEYVEEYTIPQEGEFTLYYRNDASQWLAVIDEELQKVSFLFPASKITPCTYFVVIGFNGLPQVQLLRARIENHASLLIFNETGRELAQAKITDDWEYGTKGAFFDFKSMESIPKILEVPPETWQLMWSFQDDSRLDRYFVYSVPEKNNDVQGTKPFLANFKKSNFYALILYRDNNEEYALFKHIIGR